MRILKSEEFKKLLPYLMLAIAIIIAFRVISEIAFFANILGSAWRIISPFVNGFILAFVLNIPRNGLQRLYGKVNNGFFQKRQRGISIISVYLLMFLLIFLFVILVFPRISESVTFFIANFQTYYDAVSGFIGSVSQFIGFDLQELTPITIDPENIMSVFQNFDIASFLLNMVTNVSMAVFRGLLAFVTSLYALFEQESLKKYVRKMFDALTPKSFNNSIFKFAGMLSHNFKQYIYTQTLDSLIIGTITTIALFIMRSPFALVLGLMLGLFNYIPYFGSIVATIVAVLVVAATQGMTMGIIAAIVLLVCQQLDANFIQPKLMSGSFSLSPLLVIISITVGGALWGVFGMIAAIPVVAFLKDLLDSLIERNAEKKQLAQVSADTNQVLADTSNEEIT